MTLTMYDAIFVQNLEPPPPGAQAYAGYTDGNWPDYGAIVRAYPHVPVLSIAVFASDDADCLDVETGDATIAQIYGWFKRQQARKAFRPCVYSSVSNIDPIVATMTANGFARASYRLWSAHYGQGPHICGPATCGQTRTACDGTQWTDLVEGGRADESVLLDDFFGAPPPPPPPSGNWTEAMIANLPTLQIGAVDGPGHRFVHRVQALCTVLGASCAEDGVFGTATQAAVRQIQIQFGITADGIVGPATWGCLVAGQPA